MQLMNGHALEFAGKVVGVTGGTGFIGRHLVEALMVRGATVRLLLRRDAQRNFAVPAGAHLVHPVVGDLADSRVLAELVDGCDVVLHAAARSSVPDSFADPVGCLQTNTVGTAHLLDACRHAAVSRVVFSSTWAARSGAEERVSPYAASKAAAESVVCAFRDSYGLPVTIARLANVYGPGQNIRAIIPHLLRTVSMGEPVLLDGRGLRRDFVYVSDGVQALVDIATTAGVPDVVDVGSGTLTSLEQVLDVIAEALGVSPDVSYRTDERARAVAHRSDVAPLLARIDDWRRTTLSEGIRAMLAVSRAEEAESASGRRA